MAQRDVVVGFLPTSNDASEVSYDAHVAPFKIAPNFLAEAELFSINITIAIDINIAV